jgi:hypothetical protein
MGFRVTKKLSLEVNKIWRPLCPLGVEYLGLGGEKRKVLRIA